MGVRGWLAFKKSRDAEIKDLTKRRVKGAEYGFPSQLLEVRQEGAKSRKELKEILNLRIAKESEDTVLQEAGILSKE